jgi:hypothetical protein
MMHLKFAMIVFFLILTKRNFRKFEIFILHTAGQIRMHICVMNARKLSESGMVNDGWKTLLCVETQEQEIQIVSRIL